MEKKSNNGSSFPCERILNSLRASRAYRAISRRASRGKTGSALSSPPPPAPETKILTITAVENGKEKDVPVHGNNGDHVPIIKQAKIAPAAETASDKTKAQAEPEVHGDSSGEKKPHPQAPIRKGSEGDHIENRFREYIEGVKHKLRTVSNVGGGGRKGDSGGKEKRGATGKTADDLFTDYIHRAKMKLRTTSSIGGGKAVPSKYK